ncbi:MAG: zinc metallopeptidase [Clostridiaceae bacterium]|nr:zinc metallopeptidase [Eubacteriales bacterium]
MYFNTIGGGYDYWLLGVFAVMILGMIAQARVSGAFKKFSQLPAASGLRAEEVAQRLLDDAGSRVQINSVQGSLTDHYNPKTQTVGLSTAVYGQSSVAALAVAAHEIGHVMQHEEGYAPIKLRNAVLPVARFGSFAGPLIVIAGAFMQAFGLAMIGVYVYAGVLLFQLVTLPVELNASTRAMEMLSAGGYISREETAGVRRVLNAAAMTYVVAVLSALVTLLRFLSIANRSRRN